MASSYKTIRIRCGCLEPIITVRETKEKGHIMVEYLDNFKTENEAIKTWNAHKKKTKINSPNAKIDLCQSAAITITETKFIE